jgi:hypothetical protein
VALFLLSLFALGGVVVGAVAYYGTDDSGGGTPGQPTLRPAELSPTTTTPASATSTPVSTTTASSTTSAGTATTAQSATTSPTSTSR